MEYEVRKSIEYLNQERTRWRVVEELKCPRCGEYHVIDTLEEKLRVALYCDTHDERIPLSKHKVEAIKGVDVDSLAEIHARAGGAERQPETTRIELIRFRLPPG